MSPGASALANRTELGILARLAGPIVTSQLGIVLMGLVDTLMVGPLGKGALGIAVLGHTWSFAATVLLIGAGMGLDPWLSQAVGAQDARRGTLALMRGLLVIGALTIPVTAIHLLAGPGLAALGQPEALVVGAGHFTTTLAIGALPLALFIVLRQHLQARSRVREALVAVVVANLINVATNALLIYGYAGAPTLGVHGSAWATVFSRLAMLVTLLVLGRDALPSLRGLPWRLALSAAPLRALLGDIVPVALQTGFETWAFNTATLIVGLVDDTAVAAHGVVLNLASAPFMVALGVGAAAATRVGNLVGQRAALAPTGRAALLLGVGFMAGSAIVLAITGPTLVALVTPDPDVQRVGGDLIRIAAAFQLFDGTQAVCFGLLRGAGDTRVPSLFNIVGYWLIGLPVGYLLALPAGLGATGVWWGLTLALGIVAALLFVRVNLILPRGGRVTDSR